MPTIMLAELLINGFRPSKVHRPRENESSRRLCLLKLGRPKDTPGDFQTIQIVSWQFKPILVWHWKRQQRKNPESANLLQFKVSRKEVLTLNLQPSRCCVLQSLQHAHQSADSLASQRMNNQYHCNSIYRLDVSNPQALAPDTQQHEYHHIHMSNTTYTCLTPHAPPTSL